MSMDLLGLIKKKPKEKRQKKNKNKIKIKQNEKISHACWCHAPQCYNLVAVNHYYY